MKRHLSRIAVITAIAFGIFLGGGAVAPEEVDAGYNRRYCEVILGIPVCG